MGFILSLILLGIISISLVGFSLYLGISPMPSSRAALKALAHHLPPLSDKVKILELGSGWGGPALLLARAYPKAEVIAYELSPLPYLFLCLRKWLHRQSNLTLQCKDFFKADLKDADLIYAYLFPGAMERLEHELGEGELISLAFALPQTAPRRVVYLGDLLQTPLYFYSLRRSKEGI